MRNLGFISDGEEINGETSFTAIVTEALAADFINNDRSFSRRAIPPFQPFLAASA
jgi:hypothetical protein